MIKILAKLIRLIGYLFPKDENLWVFGAWLGQRYADNSKYLFEYMSNNVAKEKTVWLTANPEVYSLVKSKGYNVSYSYSIRGIWYGLRAKYLVICVSYEDIGYASYLFSAKSTIINLWHGTPLKKLVINRDKSNQASRNALLALLGRECDYVCSSSDPITDKLQDYFHINRDRYLVTGYPRNDALFQNNHQTIADSLLTSISGKKMILYMPTFREYKNDGKPVDLFADYGFDDKQIGKVLDDNNAVLVVKMHFRDRPLLDRVKKLGRENILVLDDSQIQGDIYPLLALTDLLITDYSSVFFDYLLLDRPMIFSSFDLDKYSSLDRGFYFDFNVITPGPKVRNWGELTNEISKAFKDDTFSDHRERVNLITNKYRDGESSRRIYEAVKRT